MSSRFASADADAGFVPRGSQPPQNPHNRTVFNRSGWGRNAVKCPVISRELARVPAITRAVFWVQLPSVPPRKTPVDQGFFCVYAARRVVLATTWHHHMCSSISTTRCDCCHALRDAHLVAVRDEQRDQIVHVLIQRKPSTHRAAATKRPPIRRRASLVPACSPPC